jgi:hypothetical protein
MLTPRLYYGVTAAWLGITLREGLTRGDAASRARDRAQRGSAGAGIGYALTSRTVLTVDMAGGSGRTSASRNEDETLTLLQNGVERTRFASLHGAVQQDVTRRLFVSASLLQVWQSHALHVDLFPDRYGQRTLVQDAFFAIAPGTRYGSRFSDFGVGWRFARDLLVQYVYSTDYGVTSATHSVLFRWTWHGKGD